MLVSERYLTMAEDAEVILGKDSDITIQMTIHYIILIIIRGIGVEKKQFQMHSK